MLELCYNDHTMNRMYMNEGNGVIMIIISKSSGTCGFCGASLEVEWDLDLIDYCEKGMGVCNFYQSEVDIICPKCENRISAKLRAIEYPEGILEDSSVEITKDESDKSYIKEPDIDFFDL